jgi:hypothetical protein
MLDIGSNDSLCIPVVLKREHTVMAFLIMVGSVMEESRTVASISNARGEKAGTLGEKDAPKVAQAQ